MNLRLDSWIRFLRILLLIAALEIGAWGVWHLVR